MSEETAHSVIFEDWLSTFEEKYRDETDTLNLLHFLGMSKLNELGPNYPAEVDSFERGLGYFIKSADAPACSIELTCVSSTVNGSWPPQFRSVDKADWEVWRKIPELSSHAALRIHFLALLTYDQHSKKFEAANRLITETLAAYDERLMTGWNLILRLRLALEIARKFNLDTSDLRLALFQLAQIHIVEVENGHPGLCLEALESLAAPTSRTEGESASEQVVELLFRVTKETRKMPFAHRTATDLLLNVVVDDAIRKSILQQHAEVLLAEALSAESGLGRQSLLLETISYAKQYHIREVKEAATVELQKISLSDLQLQRVGVEFGIPRYVFDVRKKYYERTNSFGEAINLWLLTGAPTGNHEKNLEHAKKLSQGRIIAFFDRIVLNEHGLPIRKAHGESDLVLEKLQQLEELTISNSSTCLATELDFIAQKFQAKGTQITELQYLFDKGLNEELLEEFGRILQYYWDQDYAAAGRAAYTLIEAGMRNFLLTCGEPLFQTETGKTSGRFPSLETYAEKLRNLDFDEDWLRTITGFVARLRNDLAHGHQLSVNRLEAALLIRVAGLFVTISHTPKPDLTDSERSVLDPLRWGAGQRLWKWEEFMN